MANSKKCNSCGQWSETNAANCPSCGNAYDPVERNFSQAIKNAVERTKKEKEFINSGNLFQRIVKRSAWVAHLIFGALSAAFVWWIAVFHY